METKIGEEAINHKEVVSHDHLICNALYNEVFNQVSEDITIYLPKSREMWGKQSVGARILPVFTTTLWNSPYKR